MKLNADFSKRASVHGSATPWVDSPIKGVQRRMLDRIGDEVARATSIVKYDPGSQFSPHEHTGGEEFVVLEGVFQDEHGDFPAGSYIRNPPTSRHTPGSEAGCTIFVKLWQFDPMDRIHVRIDFNKIEGLRDESRTSAGESMIEVSPLYEDARETVQIEYWPANTTIQLDAPEGIELFVLQGDFSQQNERFAYQSWLRLPCGTQTIAATGGSGARVWSKSRHLPYAYPPKI